MWIYTWDGLGRLRTQTDARHITLAYSYDALNRMKSRFMQPTTSGPFLREAKWTYDGNGALGMLTEMDGAADTVSGAVDDGSDYFSRVYQYDSMLRPKRVDTHTPGGAGWTAHNFTYEMAYDQNYGRPKAMYYPGGEMAEIGYTPLGFAQTESPLDATGAVDKAYRTVQELTVRGQVKCQTFGNNIEEVGYYDDSTGAVTALTAGTLPSQPPVNHCTGTATPLIRTLQYNYDQFLNLATQQKTLPSGEVVSEAYAYDELQRLTGATRTWPSGTTLAGGTRASDTYTYDDLGNILTKTDYNSPNAYQYVGGRPHAVSDVGSIHFTYDANGNMTGGDGRTLVFDNLDRPITVTMGSTTLQFRYAPDGSRYVQAGSDGSNEYYVDKLYEQIESSTSIEQRTHISDAVEIVQTDTRKVRYRHLDRLGSLEAATTDTGIEDPSYAHGYDAFGDPRSVDWQNSGDRMNQADERGFTGHEHLDNVRLIHMNGRVYDYKLGRFLSVDPIVSGTGSQAMNPYSYIGNNPLGGIDPTGYESISADVGQKLQNAISKGIISGDTPLLEGLQKAGVSVGEAAAVAANAGVIIPSLQNNGAQSQQQSANQLSSTSLPSTASPAQTAQGAAPAVHTVDDGLQGYMPSSGHRSSTPTPTPEQINGALADVEANPEIGDRIRSIRQDPQVILNIVPTNYDDPDLQGGAHTVTTLNQEHTAWVITMKFNMDLANDRTKDIAYPAVDESGNVIRGSKITSITLPQLIAHELGHAEEQLIYVRDPSRGSREEYDARSKNTATYFENVMRGNGPFKQAHDVPPGR